MLKVELIFTGNELVNGRIVNTNARWMARRLTKRLFCQITRITTVPDDLRLIASVIREALARAPDFIMTSGGLGSTFDDMTLSAVSEALELPLKINEEAYKQVERSYQFGQRIGLIKEAIMTKYREKMATLPEGAIPLKNHLGAAPGVLLKDLNGTTSIICLPGVPAELKSIFRRSVDSLIKEKSDEDVIYLEKSFFVEGFIESEITEVSDEVMKEVNQTDVHTGLEISTKSDCIWVKTFVKAMHKRIVIEFVVTAVGKKDIAPELVDKGLDLLKKKIVARGGEIIPKDKMKCVS
ncbi:MAG: molybdopterin-binding protein [Candidatus Helarchaeota archaeon]